MKMRMARLANAGWLLTINQLLFNCFVAAKINSPVQDQVMVNFSKNKKGWNVTR